MNGPIINLTVRSDKIRPEMKDIDAEAVTAVSLDVDTAAMDKFDEDDVLRLTLFKRKRGYDWAVLQTYF